MMYLFAKLIFWLSGWKLNSDVHKEVRHAVMCAAPHTSNWDIIYARAAFYLMKLPVRFTIKKEWLKFPMNLILGPLGALPIDRNKVGGTKASNVELMIDLFKQHEELIILVTPEGTRKYQPRWRSGFYHVAVGAGVPIMCGYLDYSKKEAGIGPVIDPQGKTFDETVEEMKSFYRTKKGKYPEKGIK